MLIGSGMYFLELGFPELDFAFLDTHEETVLPRKLKDHTHLFSNTL